MVFALILTLVYFFHLRDCWIRRPVARLPDACDHAYVPVFPGQRLVLITRESFLLTVVYRGTVTGVTHSTILLALYNLGNRLFDIRVVEAGQLVDDHACR